jgi:DNA-binding transcriptional MerR regulator
MAGTESTLFAYEENDSKKDKSPNALRTISEASELLDVPQHVLRFWETKFNQIKPLKRNGGRRFYRPQDLDVLQQIKHLLYSQGYTIKGAKKAVDEFIHARATGVVTNTSEWIASIPAANVNDNVAGDDQDTLAEIAQALTESEAKVEELTAQQSAQIFPREALEALRAELIQSRDKLRSMLPAPAVAVH